MRRLILTSGSGSEETRSSWIGSVAVAVVVLLLSVESSESGESVEEEDS